MKSYNLYENKEKIYKFTENEYRELLERERINGAEILTDYIIFCYNNYYLKKNVAGICQFVKDMFNFITNNSGYIHNQYGYTFDEYKKMNLEC